MRFIEESELKKMLDKQMLVEDVFSAVELKQIFLLTPLTPEQVEGLKKKEDSCCICGGCAGCQQFGFDEAISHINANYWLIPKIKKEAQDET